MPDDRRPPAGVARIDTRRAQNLWRRARTFEELCELGARFVEGEVPLFPGWLWPTLDEESDPCACFLSRWNRAGLLTLASQPGVPERPGHDGAPMSQRAFVAGFARADVAERIARLHDPAHLLVAVFERGRRSGGVPVPVSLRAGEAIVFAGHNAFEEELVCFEDHVGTEALRLLGRCRYISIIDLEWGRNDRLWSSLDSALRA